MDVFLLPDDFSKNMDMFGRFKRFNRIKLIQKTLQRPLFKESVSCFLFFIKKRKMNTSNPTQILPLRDNSKETFILRKFNCSYRSPNCCADHNPVLVKLYSLMIKPFSS